jgi:hypothetical protein
MHRVPFAPTTIHLCLSLVAGYFGFALLSDYGNYKLSPAARNLLGISVLVAGFVIGTALLSLLIALRFGDE